LAVNRNKTGTGMFMKSNKPILLVEDDKIDAMTVKKALKEIKVANEIVNVTNGLEALEYLRNCGDEKPCIILLDLNMPKMNGVEFLREAKKDDALKMIPVIVLTTSKEEKDRMESFMLNASGYMIKPVDYQQFVETMRTIDMYWTLSEMPC